MTPHPWRIAADAEAALVFGLTRFQDDQRLDFTRISNWHRVLRLASAENAIITLQDRLESASGGSVPPEFERYLAVLALDRRARMRVLEDRLERSLAAFNSIGIDVLLLKGSALACTVYGSFSARPMKDIDLLVRRDRAADARALMLDLGWGKDPDLPGDRSYGSHHHLPPLRDCTASGLRLEIHRALLPAGHPFQFTEEEIWRAARILRVGNSHALVMHPAHHAVHAAIHFAWSHMLKFGAWHAFRDLGVLSSEGALDWDELVRTARQWCATGCCYWTLKLANAIANVPVPEEVLRSLRPRFPESFERPLLRHFANAILRSECTCPSVRLDQALWSLAMQPRREGHEEARPWSVSQDLQFAFNERTGITKATSSGSPFLQMRRSGRYLTAILA